MRSAKRFPLRIRAIIRRRRFLSSLLEEGEQPHPHGRDGEFGRLAACVGGAVPVDEDDGFPLVHVVDLAYFVGVFGKLFPILSVLHEDPDFRGDFLPVVLLLGNGHVLPLRALFFRHDLRL